MASTLAAGVEPLKYCPWSVVINTRPLLNATMNMGVPSAKGPATNDRLSFQLVSALSPQTDSWASLTATSRQLPTRGSVLLLNNMRP